MDDTGEGEAITLYAGFNEHDEARYIVETIESEFKKGTRRSEMASSTAPTPVAVLEEALLREKIPYRIMAV